MTTDRNHTAGLSRKEKQERLAQLLQRKANEPEIRSLSFAQEQLWFLDQLKPDSAAYNIARAFRLSGPLDVAALTQSLNVVVQRHETLRTTFAARDGQPVQVVAPALTLELPVVDLRVPMDRREAEIQRRASEEILRPFDLSCGPLLRVLLLRLDDQEHVLLFVMHHIVSDGWSLGVLNRELSVLYEAFSGGRGSPLAELPFQYADFADWQRQRLQGEVLDRQLAYWKGKLGGVLPVLELPTDRPRGAVQTFVGSQCSFELSAELWESLKVVSQQEGVTMFMTLLAAFEVLLARYTRQMDVLVGSPVANRSPQELEGLIGLFVNTVVLRTDLSGNPSFREVLKRVREVTLEAYEHQEVPFGRLVEELRPERDASRNPLFQVMFAYQNVPMLEEVTKEVPSFGDVAVRVLELEAGAAQFDLTLSMRETGWGLAGVFNYNTDLYEAATIGRMVGHWQTLLASIAADAGQRVWELPLLTKEERQQVVVEWNDTGVRYEAGGCIHELFEEQAGAHPERVALVYEGEEVTYGELERRANRVGHYLRRLGVGAEVLVGICVERSIEMVVGLLGILKAGGAYVPLDPAYPRERLGFMVADARVKVILSQQRVMERLPAGEARVVCLDGEWAEIARESEAQPAAAVVGDNLAYVIYTSGSTGQPKGVMNTHRGIRNRLLWMQDAYHLTEMDRVLQKTSFSFDVSVWEFFWPLLTGAVLVIARPEGHKDSAYLVELIAGEEITTVHFVPPMLDAFLLERGVQACVSLKRVICSGEELPLELQQRFISLLQAELHNLYGPTEAAVDVTFWHCRRGSTGNTVPIGRPIANTQIYLLDEHLNPVPVGVPGELHIGGLGLARGYLNRAALTAAKFIPGPFSGEAGARLYRTGDLARYRPEGDIEFLGRLDNQVKIRGFRVELGEIEVVLRQHPAVREGVVIVREDVAGDKRLVAYVVIHEGQAVLVEELRGYLRDRLPGYMVPSALVMLAALPLTPNGKVDRRALPRPGTERSEWGQAYVAPRTPVEEVLAGIWAGVLGLDRVGVYDNFFELGGHSLLGVQVIARACRTFNLDIPLTKLF
ncbi:MAG: amino acid adenylation domain-containing protein, partial [Planctomycetaceae bacterium]